MGQVNEGALREGVGDAVRGSYLFNVVVGAVEGLDVDRDAPLVVAKPDVGDRDFPFLPPPADGKELELTLGRAVGFKDLELQIQTKTLVEPHLPRPPDLGKKLVNLGQVLVE